MIRLVWTKSNSILSVFIRFLTGEDCSHFAFVFESTSKGLMFESNLLGTHPAFFINSLKTHTIVHEKLVPVTLTEEEAVWNRTVEKYDGKPYDFLGAIYLGYYKFLHRLFKSALPKQNKWANPNAYFCDEIYEIFHDIGSFPEIGISSGMESPHDVWLKLKDWECG